MKLTLFKRVREKIRHPFQKGNTEIVVVLEAIPQLEVDSAAEVTINKPSVTMSADKCAEQVRYFLLKDSKLVGKPLSSYHPEIRIIRVGNFVNAFLSFLYVCDQRLLTYRQAGGHLHCTAAFPDKSESLYFTNKVTCRNKEDTVAVLKIDYMGLKPRVSGIRFELSIKE